MPYSRNQLALIAAGFCLDCEKTELPPNSRFRRCFKCRLRKSQSWVVIKRIDKKHYDRERYIVRKAEGSVNGRRKKGTTSNIADDS